MTTIRFGLAAAALILTISAPAGAQTSPQTTSQTIPQTWPDRTITLLNPFPAGASTDQISRLIQPKLQAALGQTVVIENKAGGGGNVGTAQAARAAPDGYTLLTAPNANFTITPHFVPPPFDPIKDFAPITTVAGAPLALAVHKSLGVNSVKELIEYARKHPGQLTFGSSGVGSPHHVAGELINAKAGINMTHVPYKGGAAAQADLTGGHIKVAVLTFSTVAALDDAAPIKVLAVTGKDRIKLKPDIPAMSETIPGFDVFGWIGVFAPAGTPQPVIARLNAEITKILNDPEIIRRLESMTFEVIADSPEGLAERIRSEHAMWGAVVKAGGKSN
jgi:tripartite-type tricarboxylate transporter receptor subunit TctC